ncbi:major tail protein [Leuconostoc falkenbergense]
MLLTGLHAVLLVPYTSRAIDSDLDASKYILLNGSNGGPTQVNIQNLSATQTTQYGGDSAYLVIGSGNGQVSGSFNLLDFPFDKLNSVLGYTTDEKGIAHHGNKTIAPYYAMYVLSHDKDGKAAWLGLPRVQFARGDVNPQTNNDNTVTSTDQLTWRGMNRADGDIFMQGTESTETTEADFQTALFGKPVLTSLEGAGTPAAPAAG